MGMLMFVVANLAGSSIQITTLPLPVLSTLQASGLVFNSICATLVLGEPFTRWSLGGTILVCAGAVLIALFGAIPEPAHNLDQLLDLLGRQAFILWMIAQAILVLIIIGLAKSLKYLNPHAVQSPRLRLLRGTAYGCISGILSAHSLLVAKTAVELLVRTIVDRVNQFNRWQSWMILLLLIFLALTQLYYLHRGLKLCSTSVLYPLVFCIYNIIAILDGLIYFHQISLLTSLHASLIALGTVILLGGVLALSWRLHTPFELDNSKTQPQVTQSALMPGMGLVDDPSPTSSIDSDYILDAEAAAAEGERRPLLGPQEPLTPTTRAENILAATKGRRRGITEAAEIWGELADEDSPSTKRGWSPLTPQGKRKRRASTMTFSRNPARKGNSPSPGYGALGRASTFAFGIRNKGKRKASEGRRSSLSQGGRGTEWWKMKWWKRRDHEDDEGGGAESEPDGPGSV